MTAHARLSPSASDRWATCAGSVRLIEMLRAAGVIPENTSSYPASEGTAAHTVRADCFDLGLEPWDFHGTQVEADGILFDVNEEMCEALQIGIDWVREQPVDVVTEFRVDLGRWLPGQFGTLDTAIIDLNARRLTIVDLKYGIGLWVDVFGTRQLRIYALGVVDYYDLYNDIDEIVLVIDQPRKGGLKPWSITMAELLAFGEEIRAAGEAVDAENPPLVYSPKACEYCPVKDAPDGCPAYDAHFLDLFEEAFADPDADVTFPPPSVIDPARRYIIASNAAAAKKWLDSLVTHSTDAGLAGKPDPGSKVIHGPQGDREWSDPEAAEAVIVKSLGDEAFTKKLKGPAPVEKLLKPGRKKEGDPEAWAALSKLITRPEGKPLLVSEDDHRPAIRSLQSTLDELEDFS